MRIYAVLTWAGHLSQVWTCADSRDPRAGAYQRYSIAKACKVGRIPDNIDDEGAATIGTGLVTAAVILYWFFGFGLPKSTEAAPVAPVDVSSQTISIDDASKWVL